MKLGVNVQSCPQEMEHIDVVLLIVIILARVLSVVEPGTHSESDRFTMSKIALITGIAGQDGSYLSEHLLNLGYEVHGLIRRNSTPEHQESRLDFLGDAITCHYSDLTDVGSLYRLIESVKPDEIYNLAAQSHVRISYEIPQFTASTNALGALNLLEAIRLTNPKIKYYQASSSEMFGSSVDDDGFQRETTPMHPVSPYGCSKLFAYSITRNYRAAYGIFAANGILFNHESPRRGSNFVTSKVIKTAVEIKYGLRTSLVMGNLDSYRDWGHSRDYVRAMHSILSHESADDFVVATGETRSVRDLLEITFSKLGMDYREYVTQDKRYMRPEELPYLKGDASKIKSLLGWKPEVTFDQLISEMTDFWDKKIGESI
jgi:GDPmannose 4,6-dehydratase